MLKIAGVNIYEEANWVKRLTMILFIFLDKKD